MVQTKLDVSNTFQSLCSTINENGKPNQIYLGPIVNWLLSFAWWEVNDYQPICAIITSMNLYFHSSFFSQPTATDRLRSAAERRFAQDRSHSIIQHCICSTRQHTLAVTRLSPPEQCLLTPNHSSGLQFDSSKWTGDIQCQTFIFTIKCYLRGTRVSPLRINPKWLS